MYMLLYKYKVLRLTRCTIHLYDFTLVTKASNGGHEGWKKEHGRERRRELKRGREKGRERGRGRERERDREEQFEMTRPGWPLQGTR